MLDEEERTRAYKSSVGGKKRGAEFHYAKEFQRCTSPNGGEGKKKNRESLPFGRKKKKTSPSEAFLTLEGGGSTTVQHREETGLEKGTVPNKGREGKALSHFNWAISERGGKGGAFHRIRQKGEEKMERVNSSRVRRKT